MKLTIKFALSVVALAALAVFAVAYANDSNEDNVGPYKKLTTVSIPDLVGFDISWVDSASGRYYLADRGTGNSPATPRIDVIDTEHNKLVDQIPLHTAGNGVVAIRRTGDDEGEDGPGTLVVGGNDSTAIFIDLAHSHSAPEIVPTGGTGRADELAYDPQHHLILIANDRAADLFVTFISTTKPRKSVGQIKYDGSIPGNPKSTGGIEQPVWDGSTGKFYISIPATTDHPNGEVDEIDPVATPASGDTAGKITRIFPTSCGPAGLVLIPGQRLMTSCGDVLDIKDGKVVHTVPGVAADEIWFNSGDGRVYFGHNPAFVVDAETYEQITGGGAPIPAGPTHSIAADKENNHIFIPVTGSGVKVYTDDVDKGKGNEQ